MSNKLTNFQNFKSLEPTDKATVWTPEAGEAKEIEVQIPGPPGPPATMLIGIVTQSTTAGANIRPGPTEGSWYLDLELPEGERGRKGDNGSPATFEQVNITTLPAGSAASGSITGTAPNYTLNLSIPTGPRGNTGAPGPDNFSIWLSQPENAGKGWDEFWESLRGEPGKTIELGVSATHIQWRVVGDSTWIDLVALADLKGDKGDKGEGLQVDVVDTEANKDLYDGELAGFTLLTSDTATLYIKKSNASGDWFDGVPLVEPGGGTNHYSYFKAAVSTPQFAGKVFATNEYAKVQYNSVTSPMTGIDSSVPGQWTVGAHLAGKVGKITAVLANVVFPPVDFAPIPGHGRLLLIKRTRGGSTAIVGGAALHSELSSNLLTAQTPPLMMQAGDVITVEFHSTNSSSGGYGGTLSALAIERLT